MPVGSVAASARTLPTFRPAGGVPGIGMRVESVRNAPSPAFAPPVEDYDSRVLMSYGSDVAVVNSLVNLYAKHRHNTVAIHRTGEGCPPHIVAGDLDCLGGRMKVQLVGHGDHAVGRQLGSVDADTIAQHIATLCDVVNRTTPSQIAKVSAVGCRTGDNSEGRSFARQLACSLAERGIHAPVKGYVWRVYVDADGHKVLTDDNRIRVDGRRV